MISPTRHVWDALDRPDPVPSAAAKLDLGRIETCRMCGHDDLPTADAKAALGTNWTDQSCWRDPSSTRVCVACLWTCSGKPPATVRMWTVVTGVDRPSGEKAPWRSDAACLTNRADTTPVISTLCSPPAHPWLVSIAVSGQKHILPYGTVNPGGTGPWRVRMEDTTISSDPATFSRVHSHALALRRLGIRDDDILTGHPGSYLKTLEEITEWREHANHLTAHIGAPLLRLALWTITKKEITAS